MKLLMVNEDFWGKTLKNPDMSESFIWGHPRLRIPIEAPLHEVDKVLVFAFEDILQSLSARLSHLPS
jgi:hypothetical protein